MGRRLGGGRSRGVVRGPEVGVAEGLVDGAGGAQVKVAQFDERDDGRDPSCTRVGDLVSVICNQVNLGMETLI